MRIFILISTIFLLVQVGWAGTDLGLVTTSDYLRIPVIAVNDTGLIVRPDSGAVIVWFEGEADNDTSSYTYVWTTGGATDAIMDSFNLVSTTVWYFVDAVGDIDDGQGEGNYTGVVILYADDQPFYNNFSFILYDEESEAILDKIAESLDTLQNQDNWIGQNAYFDTLIYQGAVWVDAAASNTNTVVGTDGTEKNPVSTLGAARTIADALGLKKYCILNNSSLTLAAQTESWIWQGVGHENTINLGSQDCDNSVFFGLTITGIQGGNGKIHLRDCDISNLHDFDGEALNCWLIDSLVMDNNSEAYLGNCFSAVAGNGTPAIDFHIASNNISMRNYSGGINIINMSSNDNLSLEGNGQLIVDATCSNASITVRGNFTITDNGSGTVITKDAAFSRQEADLWIWSNADTTHVDSSDVGVWLVNNNTALSDILIPFSLFEGAMSITKYNSNQDTIFVITTDRSDTTSVAVYYHIGGVAGQRPDSVKYINWP